MMKVKGNLVLKKDLKINEDLVVEGNIVCEGGRWNIDARNINARNINARNINCLNINALNISANHISYYAVCFAYQNIKCKSIKGRRENSKHFVLDGKIIKEKSK